MKKIYLFLVLFFGLIICTKNALAYGAGGFPPGYFDNPHARAGLVCKFVTMNLPNGRQVTVPKCEVIRNKNQDDKNISQRMTDFFERVKKGGK
jgi:hypothetical protein